MESVITVIRKRCPLDATILVRQEVEGLLGWYCPECEYFEPDAL